MRTVVVAIGLSALFADVAAQTPGAPNTAGPTFDVISIKPNTASTGGFSMRNSPNGSFTLTGGTIRMLLTTVYPGLAADPIGLPEWAASARYDVMATAALPRAPTPDDRRSMMRALLADRFKFLGHIEKREFPAFDLVLARSDGRPGPSLKPSEVDCAARAAQQRAAAEAARAGGAPPPPPPLPPTMPDPNSPVPPCSMRMLGNVMEGDFTMASLASLLRSMAGRHVVDRTGLEGNYRIRLEASRTQQGPAVDAATDPGTVPSVFTALQEQLGLKLEPSRAALEVLVVDRIERPTEN